MVENGAVKFREFAFVVLLPLPNQGRAEYEINTFSQTLTAKISSLLVSPGILT